MNPPITIRGALIADTHQWHVQFGRATRGASLAGALWACMRDLVLRKYDFGMLAGDIINAVRPTPETVLLLKAIDKFLRQHGLAMYCISGNHDFTGANHWIHAATDQDANQTDDIGLIMIDWQVRQVVPGLRILGIPGVDADEIRRRLPELPDVEIVLAHFTPKEHMGFANDRSLAVNEVVRDNTELVALGDYHEPFCDKVTRADGKQIYAAMPGSTAHCAVSESDDKGYYGFTFENHTVTHVERHLVSSYDILRIDLSADENALQTLKDTLGQRDGTRELLLVVKFDATKHSLKTALEVLGDAPNVTVLSRPYLSEKVAAVGEAQTPTDGELRPLESFQGEYTTKVPILDNAITAILKRVPESDKITEQAITDFLKDDTWMSSNMYDTPAST